MLTVEQQNLCNKIGATPRLLSLLYDIDLLPEQIKPDDARRWGYLAAIVGHFESIAPPLSAERAELVKDRFEKWWSVQDVEGLSVSYKFTAWNAWRGACEAAGVAPIAQNKPSPERVREIASKCVTEMLEAGISNIDPTDYARINERHRWIIGNAINQALSEAPSGWVMVPKEPTPTMLAAAANAVVPRASAEDIALARKAAILVIHDTGQSIDMMASTLATMPSFYRAMLSAIEAAPGEK